MRLSSAVRKGSERGRNLRRENTRRSSSSGGMKGKRVRHEVAIVALTEKK
jgi:hypothetical protein